MSATGQNTNTFTLPAGRLLNGNIYTTEVKKDQNGKDVIGKDGKPVMQNYFAVGIPKSEPGNPQKWWWHEAWGAPIYQVGGAEMPQTFQNKAFAWKIEDGDSQEPNKRGRKNADREGFPGHWIVKCSSSYAPSVYTLIGQPVGKPAPFPHENGINPGDYVQVNITVAGNKRTDSPGIYVNPNIVCLLGFGQRIAQVGVDPESAGFGVGVTLPAGASTTPPAGFVAPAPAPAAAPSPAAAPAPAPAPGPAPAPAPAPLAIQPHTGITQPPAAPGPAPAAPAPSAPLTTPGSRWNRTATWPLGVTDEQMLGQGWTEATLRQHGYIV
jgi:hypothetical protein